MNINKKEDVYKELGLFINKLMLDDKYITYDLYKIVESIILNDN